jgi:hypothetical protein
MRSNQTILLSPENFSRLKTRYAQKILEEELFRSVCFKLWDHNIKTEQDCDNANWTWSAPADKCVIYMFGL